MESRFVGGNERDRPGDPLHPRRSGPVTTRTVVLAMTLLATCRTVAAQAPPAPVPPAVISRSAAGGVTVRATRLTDAMQIDGRLDEDVYGSVPAISDFLQTLPLENSAPTEQTEAWVMFDSTNLYVSARCWDSAPPDKWIANEMRRDTSQLRQNDQFGVMLDTFHDRRNGYLFYGNPIGGRADVLLTDEGNPNLDWNPVWDIRTGRFEGGWTIEMAIPFKSLRYVSGTAQTWGIQLRRGIRHKNEWNYLTPLPLAMGGPAGFFRISAAATLIGLDLPAASRNIELKPYGISRITSDRVIRPDAPNEVAGAFGIDAKYGVTANLTADLTYNTDFAQVEVDEQQVNLTRFNLVLPEKRDFFLEGRGLFNFAAFPTTGGGGTGANAAEVPALFYSRRIGLNRGRVIPIDVGARLTGKVGRFGLGLLNIQTGDEAVSGTPATNFTVLRVKRDLLRRSSVGVMATNRSVSADGTGTNQAYGADATFSFFNNLDLGGYYARTATQGLKGDDDSYLAKLEFSPDQYGARFEYLKVGDNFNPEVGFLRRDDFKRTFGSLRFSPRPKSIRAVRQFTLEGTLNYLVNGSADLESRQQGVRASAEFENSDRLTVEPTRNYELLVRPFPIAPNVKISPGNYTFSDVEVSYALGQQRRASGTVALQLGHFYDGTIHAVSYTAARVSVLKQLSVEPTVSVSQIDLPAGHFTTTLVRARTDYAFSPRQFVSALLQYSSGDRTFSSNLRLRWEYHPGSEIFVVYTDERDTLARGWIGLKNRAFVVKINRLFRF